MLILSMAIACGPADHTKEISDLLNQGNYIESIELIREMLDEDPTNPELLFLYGQTLIASGQPGLADWPLRKAMEDPAWFEIAGMAAARAELHGNNYENAAELLGRVVEKNPENMEARVMRAQAFANEPRMLHDALEEVDQILEINPDETRALEARILAYLNLDDEDGATKAIDELGAKIEEGNVDDQTAGWFCATMAIFANDSGYEDLARERWADCNARFPDHNNVVMTSTAFFDKQGEMEQSLEIVQAAFRTDPSPASGYRELVAQYLNALDRADEAEKLLREAAESDDPNESMKGNLALARHLEDAGEYAAAANALEAGMKIYTTAYGPSPDLQFWLADLLIFSDQHDRVLALADTMTVGAQRALLRARVAHKREDYAKAIALYDEAARLWPSNPYAPYHAGHAALALGDFDAALRSFRSAIRIAPAATDAPHQVARINAAHGRWGAAADIMGQFSKELSPEAGLFWLEIVGHLHSAPAAGTAISAHSEKHPHLAGASIAAGAKGVGEVFGPEAAWTLVQVGLDTELPVDQQVPILESAVRWAPGDAELSVVDARIRKLVEENPELASARAIEGSFRLRKGMNDLAVESFRAALALQPDEADAALRLASLVGKKDPDEAASLIEGVLGAVRPGDPMSFDADLFLSAVESLEGTERVASMLELALKQAPTSPGIALRLVEVLEEQGGEEVRIAALTQRVARFERGKTPGVSETPLEEAETSGE